MNTEDTKSDTTTTTTLEKSLVKFNKLDYRDEIADSMLYIITQQETTNCGWVFLSMTSIEPKDKKISFPQSNNIVLTDTEYQSLLIGEHELYSIIARGE